jgi:hypothetical protein
MNAVLTHDPATGLDESFGRLQEARDRAQAVLTVPSRASPQRRFTARAGPPPPPLPPGAPPPP